MAVVAVSDTTGLDSKIDDMALYVAELFKERVQILADHVLESPIEKLFAAGLYAVSNTSQLPRRVKFTTFECVDRDTDVLNVIPQHDMYVLTGWNYRVDFLLMNFQGDGVVANVLIVECDGYQWHDRSKEEFARERKRNRDLMAMGYPVVSFAGSEVWENARACAAEAMRILDNMCTYLTFPEPKMQNDNEPAITDRSKQMAGN